MRSEKASPTGEARRVVICGGGGRGRKGGKEGMEGGEGRDEEGGAGGGSEEGSVVYKGKNLLSSQSLTASREGVS